MRLTFLGTSAANAYPEAFCRCSNCQGARAEGGRSLRKRSSALVNDDLLIDLGPDIMAAAQMHQLDLTKVGYCLQTHPHADHMDLSHLLSRSPGFGVVGAPCLHFCASAATLERADQTFSRDLSGYGLFDPAAGQELNLELHRVEPPQSVHIGPYRVIAFPANHAPGLGALLYAVEREGHCIFYGIDTAVLPEGTWQALRQQHVQFDLVVLDHTYGPDEEGGDHLSAHELAAHARRMREEGLLKEGGRVFASHIAHEGNPPHAELVVFASQHGYEVAYDGLSVTA
jgi:phosphoribosyl 1,2-cyclic phosphate phosphodiesterase